MAENQGSASGKLLGNLGHAELYPSVIFYRVKYFLRKKKKEREISMETQGWDACLCDVSADSPRRPMCLPCPPLCQKVVQGVELDTGRSTSSERLPRLRPGSGHPSVAANPGCAPRTVLVADPVVATRGKVPPESLDWNRRSNVLHHIPPAGVSSDFTRRHHCL